MFGADGLPRSYMEYEEFCDGVWSKVTAGIPGKIQFVRYAAKLCHQPGRGGR